MSHKLGVYFAPEHGFKEDRDYIAALQPPVVRILDPDVQQIADVHALAPHAIIAPRTWVIDDHDGQAVRSLMADPLATGRDHAEQYRAQLDRWQREARERGLRLPPADRMYFNSANEPNQGGTPDKIAAYCVAFLDRCTQLSIRAVAPCLGVGWPDNNGPDTPVNWQPYANAGLEQAIKRGNHWLCLHEYHYKTGPQDGWRWWAGRHLQCPFDVPILLGEIGIDNYVDNARWQREGGNRGWQGNVDPDTYAEMIAYHISHSDQRVVAALPFITDFRSPSWESFNTRPAHAALLGRKDRMVPQGKFTTRLPHVQGSPKPAEPPGYVIAPAGVNLRVRPGGDLITAIPYGEQVRIIGVEQNGWLRVRYGQQEGWVSATYIGLNAPEPLPAPTNPPTPSAPATEQEAWQRSRAFIAKWEGGYQNYQNDAGNWTGCEVGKGELKGTKYGISACSYPHLDIRNLTEAQADAIYYTDYWQRSGANKLSWPLCLLILDTAVLHGVGTAQTWLKEVGANPYLFAAKRLRVYTAMSNWGFWGKAWVQRVSDLLEEMSK